MNINYCIITPGWCMVHARKYLISSIHPNAIDEVEFASEAGTCLLALDALTQSLGMNTVIFSNSLQFIHYI